jgi:hypothetical protein
MFFYIDVSCKYTGFKPIERLITLIICDPVQAKW